MVEQPVRVIKRGLYRDGILVASDKDTVTVRFDDEPPGAVPFRRDDAGPDEVTFARSDVEIEPIPRDE